MLSDLNKPSQTINEDALDEKAELLLVRNVRLKINKFLMADGVIPSDPEKLDFLMQNLRDMDKSALTRSKISSEEKAANLNAGAISLVTNVLQSLRGGKALPPEDISDLTNPEECAPVLPIRFEKTSFIPGEQYIGSVTEDIDTFRKRMYDESGEGK